MMMLIIDDADVDIDDDDDDEQNYWLTANQGESEKEE